MNHVSIVIPVSGHAAITRRCLETLSAAVTATDGLQLEVVVVDDGSEDETADLLRGYAQPLTIVTHEGQHGFASACNAGAAAASGDQLLFLNNDTISEEN